jgi:hypothetical protein
MLYKGLLACSFGAKVNWQKSESTILGIQRMISHPYDGGLQCPALLVFFHWWPFWPCSLC